MGPCTNRMWCSPLWATASCELLVACSWLPELSKQSYSQSNKDLFKLSPLQSSETSSIDSPSWVFFLISYSEERAENRKLSKGITRAEIPALYYSDVQSTSLAWQQLDTQKWRPWKILTLYRSLWETSKRLCRDKGGQEARVPSATHSSCSSQILQYISLEKTKARTETKTHRKKHPTVLNSMDTIKAKAFKEGCTHLTVSDPWAQWNWWQLTGCGMCPKPVLYAADFQGTSVNQADQSKLISLNTRQRKFPKASLKIPACPFSVSICM